MNPTQTNQFFEAIKGIPTDRIYIQDESHTLTYGDIYPIIKNFSEEHHYLEGKHCALVTSSRYDLAKYLPVLASLASKIYLQPSCLNEETVQEFYKKSLNNLKPPIKLISFISTNRPLVPRTLISANP